ncbi:tape measure protein [Chromobacterium violaceum]|uniref:tape measure protein n=1 Tax=Chromobacterium violaceum TaxID=536 RepID=UPI00385A7010
MSNDIEVRIGARTQELQDGMGRASRVIADSVADIKRQMDGLGNMFNSIIGLAGGAGLAMLGRQAVGVMSNFEQLEIRLNSVMGSVGKGQEAFAWIQQFAKDTPYQVNEVTQSFMLLKNMGIDPMGGAMKSIADRAAQTGGGFETLQRISLGLGQAWTKGKLQGEEAMQLLEAGVPVWDMLSKVLGKTTAEVQELSSKGRLGRDVIKALIDEMGRSSDGAAEAQMKSLSGMWSNFIDNIEGALNRLRKDGALEPLKKLVAELNDEFGKLDSNGTLTRWSADIATNLKAVGDGLMTAGHFAADYGDQLKFLAGAYITLKAAQAGSSMASQLAEDMRARVAAISAAKEQAAADLAAANASSFASKQALLRAEAENTAAQAELRRASAAASSWQAALQTARAETDLATRTRLATQAQNELTTALAARNAAVARAATATDTLNRANATATASTQAATTAQIAFERATTLAGLAARGFSAVMSMLGGPIGIAIMALVALVTHWDDVAAAAGNAAAKSRKAADDIKQALADVDVARMQKGLKEATDEYNRIKLKRQTSAGNLTIDQQALSAAEDDARGRMLMYRKGLDDVNQQQAKNAYQPILDKYKGEDPEWRKQQEEKQASTAPSGPPQLLPEKEKKAKKAPSRLGDWNNELEGKRLNAELSGNRMSAQQEADFWAQKIELTKAGSKEREQVVRQHIRALLAIQHEGDRNSKELELAQIDAKRQGLDTALQADEAAYHRQAELQGLSASEQEAALIAFEQRRLAIQQAFIDERIATLQRDPDHNIAEVYRLQQEREQAEIQHQMKLSEIKGNSAKESLQLWDGLGDRLNSLWDKGLQAMMNGTLTWRNALRAVWADLSMYFTKQLVTEPLTKWLAMQVKKLALSMGFLSQETAATTAAASTSTAITATAATAKVGSNAAVAASGAAASQAWIPYVGPVLAVAAMGAMLASVMGMKSSIKSARGGYSIPRGVNPMTQLHEEEMVLPKAESNVIRQLANGGQATGNGAADAPQGAGCDQYHFHVNAIDSRGVERFFRDNGRSLVKALKEQGRNFAGAKS